MDATATDPHPSVIQPVNRDRWSRRAALNAVVGTVVLLAVGCALAALLTVVGGPRLEPWQLALIACMLLLSEMSLVQVRLGGDSFTFTWGEGCLLLGFALVSPPWVLLVSGPTVALVHLAKGRGPQKSIYNGAAFTVSATASAAVLGALTDAPYQLSNVRDALAMVAAGLVFSLTSALCISLVVATSQARSVLRVLLGSLRMVLLVSVGNLTCAGAVLFLAERSRATLFGLPPVMLAVLMVYRAYLRASQERDVWRQLEAASRELNHLDGDRVVTSALVRARELFHANDVDVLLAARDSQAACLYAMQDGCLVRLHGDPQEVLLGLGGAGTRVVHAGGARGSRPIATTLLTVLEGPQGVVGTLRLHFNGAVTLSARENQVLSTLAHAVAAALFNVALHEEVTAEAIRQAHQAKHDPLTGLANRILLRDRTDEALAGGSPCALLLIDLDHFKEINDTLGHAAGDALLQQVARRLEAAVPAGRLVARLGGDEFAILLQDLSGSAEAGLVAERLLLELAEPIDYQGLTLSVEGSIGVACFPQDASDAEELFRRADVAMYQAKNARGSWLRYDSLRDDSSIERLALVAELRAALDRQELVVHYQPKVELAGGRIVGAEALVRWQHPQRGLLYPDAFVGVAEQSGLVRPFTLRILEMAVVECLRWQAGAEQGPSVAVNLGARSLLDHRLPNDVAEVLDRYGLPANRLVLEITETTAASDLVVVEEVLGRLRRLGVEISVDDFGTGYSSLAFLQRTAVHELKVDRSFVSGMLVNDNDLALVRATVSLAHSLGARAVAEGVESQALCVALSSLGCDVAQGYHLGRPMPAEQLRLLLGGSAPAVPGARREPDRHLNSVQSA